jgi:hypothetical protein
MELQTKFIEGTNKQYSIREDGVVTRHYKKNRGGSITFGDIIIKCQKNGYEIYFNSIPKLITKSNLLHQTFGHILCRDCNQKMIQYRVVKENIVSQKCSLCLKPRSKQSKESKQQWRDNNPEKVLDIRKRSYLKHKENYKEKYASKRKQLKQKEVKEISKSYVATKLKISVEDLSDELYKHHKNLILFKRYISITHNVNISSLNLKT